MKKNIWSKVQANKAKTMVPLIYGTFSTVGKGANSAIRFLFKIRYLNLKIMRKFPYNLTWFFKIMTDPLKLPEEVKGHGHKNLILE